MNRSETWSTSPVNITVSLDGLELGSHNYTMLLHDTYGNSAVDQVTVTVVEGGTPPGDPGLMIAVVSIGVIAVVLVLALKRRR